MDNSYKKPNVEPGWVVWLTGLPASGKTTIARTLQHALRERGVDAFLLDSDAVRAIITPEPAYTDAERIFFYDAMAGIAAILTAQGGNVIIAATANRRTYRNRARKRLVRFSEVWVHCPLAVCRARDPKGLYAEAADEPDSTLPGLGAVYEPPETPDVTVDSSQQTPIEAAQCILAHLEAKYAV